LLLCNTVYLERAVAILREHGIRIDEKSVAQLSAIGWEHIRIPRDHDVSGVGITFLPR